MLAIVRRRTRRSGSEHGGFGAARKERNFERVALVLDSRISSEACKEGGTKTNVLIEVVVSRKELSARRPLALEGCGERRDDNDEFPTSKTAKR